MGYRASTYKRVMIYISQISDSRVILVRVAVVHHTLISTGGGERVCLCSIEAFNEMGITPDLYLMDPVDPELLNNSYGKN